MNFFKRTEMLLTESNMNKLKRATVAVFGIGGVGSYVVEALARCGVGSLILIDKDIVDETNINRQIIATVKTIGKNKVDIAKERVLEINPGIKVVTHKIFYSKDIDVDIINNCDYVVDAIDTVSSKLDLILECLLKKVPIISCMGTGNKLDPTRFMVADIYKTKVCPLCRVMRSELKKRGVKSLKVLYSDELPIKPVPDKNCDFQTQKVVGSVSFVPSVAGLIVAGEVIKDISLSV